MFKKLFSFFVLFSSYFFLNAQVKVTGVIINSETQRPISGATLVLKDTNINAISDTHGYFQLESSQYIGSLLIKVEGYSDRTISLKEGDNSNLVVGFTASDKVINKKPEVLIPETVFNGQEQDSLAITFPKEVIPNNEISPISSQNDTLNYVKVTGTVLNEDTNEPIKDADIYLVGTQYYAMPDDEGNFTIESEKHVDSLRIEVWGYPNRYVPLNRGDNLNLMVTFSKNKEKLTETTTEKKQIESITIVGFPKKKVPKKENPAYAILKELWKRKRTNGLANFKNYRYEEYEKIQFDLSNVDSAFISKKIFKKLAISTKDIDTLDISGKTYLPFFINESISTIVGKNVPTKEEKTFLTANRVSGLPDNDIVSNTVKNLYKDINIYDNTLNFFTKGFTSPVSTNGFGVYEYLLVDTVKVDGVSCFHIKYRPLRANELTFKGDLYITENTYSVRQAILSSSEGINVNFVKDIYMELEYEDIKEDVFLLKRNYTVLDISLLTKREKAKGMYAKRTLSYDNYVYDLPNDEIEKELNKKWEPITEGAYEKGNDYWQESRPENLNDDDRKTYELVDKISKTKLFNTIVDAVEILSSGYINVGKAIDIGNLYQAFGYNDVEGTRLRAGARTYFSPNDMWRVEGYGAFGFKDDKFKYGAEGRFMFNKYNRFIVGLGTKRDVSQLGVSLTEQEGIMTRSFASSSIISRGDNEYLSTLNTTNAFLSIEPWKNVQFRLDGTYTHIKSANPNKFDIGYYDNGIKHNELHDTHLTFSVQAHPGAKYSRYGIDRYEHSSLAPTIIFKYVKGFDGLLDSKFNYDKLQLLYSHPILWGEIGKTNLTVELGKYFGDMPLSLLGVIPGNQSYGLVANTFSQLNYYDFVVDVYSTLHFEHHFNGRLFSYIPLLKKLQLREVLIFRGAWGDISDHTKGINASNIEYVAPSKDIYYEYGFGIENIGFGNLRIFRFDFNWRGNYLKMKDVNKFGVKFGMQFTF